MRARSRLLFVGALFALCVSTIPVSKLLAQAPGANAEPATWIYLCVGESRTITIVKAGFQAQGAHLPKATPETTGSTTAKMSGDDLVITGTNPTPAPVTITLDGDILVLNGNQMQHIHALYKVVVVDCHFTTGDWFRIGQQLHTFDWPLYRDGSNIARFKDLGDPQCYPRAKADASYALALLWQKLDQRDAKTSHDRPGGNEFNDFKKDVDGATGDFPDVQATIDQQLAKFRGSRNYIEYAWHAGTDEYPRDGTVFGIEGLFGGSPNLRVMVVITGTCRCGGSDLGWYRRFVAVEADYVSQLQNDKHSSASNPAQKIDEIKQVCCEPGKGGGPSGGMTVERTPTPAPTRKRGIDDDPDFKSVIPQPGATQGTDGVSLPPSAGAQSEIILNVDSDSPDAQAGAGGVLMLTVDQTGDQKVYRAQPKDGRLAFVAALSGAAALATIEVLKGFDKDGKPIVASRLDIGDPAHLADTEPVANVPPSGPAIREAARSVEPRDMLTLHIQGNDPQTTRFLLDGQPMRTLAVSDNSALVRFDSATPLGHHDLVMQTGTQQTSPLTIAVVKLTPHPLPPASPGVTVTATIEVAGLTPADAATMEFAIDGDAAQIVGGGTTRTVPVTNGVAQLQLIGKHAGQILLHFHLIVKNPQFAGS